MEFYFRTPYNSYLSCVSGCSKPLFTPLAGSPPYIDYVVCGSITASTCAPNPTICDTVRVYVIPALNVSVSPNPATLCASSSVTLSSSVSGGYGSYTYIWKNASNATVGTGSSYAASATGTITRLFINDQLTTGCLISTSVAVNPNVPTAITAAGPTTFCQEDPSDYHCKKCKYLFMEYGGNDSCHIGHNGRHIHCYRYKWHRLFLKRNDNDNSKSKSFCTNYPERTSYFLTGKFCKINSQRREH